MEVRRRGLAVVAAGLVALAGVTVALRLTHDHQPSAATGNGNHSSAAYVAPGPARPLTYAEGQTIHIGQRSIDTGLDILSLDITDDGAAFTTFDGALWFTDGSTVTQIGLTSPARATRTGVEWGPAGRPDGRIVSESSGSRLAWLEYPQVGARVGQPEIVVYDTRQRRRIARLPIATSQQCTVCAKIVAVGDDSVYWSDGFASALGSGTQTRSAERLFRYAVSTRRQTQVSIRAYQDELRRTPRMIVVGSSLGAGTVEDGIGEDFAFVGGHLVVHAMGTGDTAFDPVGGQDLLLRAPLPYGNGAGPAEWFYLFEWLDDDSFALLDATSWNSGVYRGEDILVCRISSSRCNVAVHRPTSAGSPIVPGFGTPGAEIAAHRAALAQLSGR